MIEFIKFWFAAKLVEFGIGVAIFVFFIIFAAICFWPSQKNSPAHKAAGPDRR